MYQYLVHYLCFSFNVPHIHVPVESCFVNIPSCSIPLPNFEEIIGHIAYSLSAPPPFHHTFFLTSNINEIVHGSVLKFHTLIPHLKQLVTHIVAYLIIQLYPFKLK